MSGATPVRLPLIPRVPRPSVCVWEITLACDCDCVHCGSTAGSARPRELDTGEALTVIDELHALGCAVVNFSGGEPLLRRDWPVLARAVRGHGMHLELMTNGLGLRGQLDEIVAAGFRSVSTSVDGDARVHDALRRRAGCLAEVFAGVACLRERGVRVGAVTQVNRLNLESLPAIHDAIVERGFTGWLVQLTLPHGRAGQVPRGGNLCLEPAQLPRLEELLLALIGRREIELQLANTIGYMGRNEPRLRAGETGGRRVWGSCQAGLRSLGLTSDGTVRGCLSMPAAFDEANVRQRPLREIWADPRLFAYNRDFQAGELEGECAGCAYATICRGGCPGLAWAATGGTRSNPYCLHALERRAGAPA